MFTRHFENIIFIVIRVRQVVIRICRHVCMSYVALPHTERERERERDSVFTD
jgi:hypothetical protein